LVAAARYEQLPTCLADLQPSRFDSIELATCSAKGTSVGKPAQHTKILQER